MGREGLEVLGASCPAEPHVAVMVECDGEAGCAGAPTDQEVLHDVARSS
jgi:hypothetical protein